MSLPSSLLSSATVPLHASASGASLRGAATRLEAVFLAEMLEAAGVGRTPESFGGGAGETQFASFLREAQAQAMAEAGGIGLAEHLFRALSQETTDV
jgi:Rod binding domain-containing protein